jgi:4-hydroxy-2-oxoheptanedioate aldolase
MRPNALKALWQQGGAALNGWLQIPSAFTAEIMAHQGFDTITIDMQHGLMGYETAVAMLQAISTTNVTPIVRVPWNEPAAIMRMCDAGAYGIICPMVNSRAEAEAFVKACRFPPEGIRSYGPVRARLYGGNDYVENANQLVATIAMIETAEALANVEAIASVPGLDGLYVGPADLSISLGGTERTDYTEPMLVEALHTVLACARRFGVAAGLHCATPEYARKAVGMGFQFVTPSADASYLEAAAHDVVARFHATAQANQSDTATSAPRGVKSSY